MSERTDFISRSSVTCVRGIIVQTSWVVRTLAFCCACLVHLVAAVDYRRDYRVKSVRINPNKALHDPYIVFGDGNGTISAGLKQYSKIKHKYTGTIMLEYTLRFSTSFSWGEKGGLLPGLVGGRSRCAKAESGSRCWRVQLSWNPDGTAGMALRLPKDSESRVQMAVKDGIRWQTGQDNKVVVVLGVNSRRKRNGFLDISINNERLLFQDSLRFDTKSTRNKFVLRQGEYIGGMMPPDLRGEQLRYLATSDIQVYLAKRQFSPPPSSAPRPPPSPLEELIKYPPEDPSGGSLAPGEDEVWESPSPSILEPDTPPGQEGAGPVTVSVKWTTGTMEASITERSKRRFDSIAKELFLCSGDKLRLEWSGENMGVYGFYTLEHYQDCIKDNLNYIKNTRPSGFFLTKGNRGGWRYYAYITGADDGACKYGCGTDRDKGKQITGTCAQKIAVRWDKCE